MKKWMKIIPAFAVVISLCVQLAAAVSYKYDKIGRVISATYKNGTVISYAYDSSGNITKIKQDGARKIMVTFNPNGGVCSTANKTVIAGQNNGNMTHCFYGIEEDIRSPKHSGVNGTGKYNTVHMYTENYYIFGFFAGFKYVGYELDEQAQQNEEFVRWNAEKETCPTLQSR